MAKGDKKPLIGKKGSTSQRLGSDQSVKPYMKKGLAGNKANIEKLIIQNKKVEACRPVRPTAKKVPPHKVPCVDSVYGKTRSDQLMVIMQSPTRVCLPPNAAARSAVQVSSSRPMSQTFRSSSSQEIPIPVQSGLFQDNVYKVLDVRHEYPGMPLVRVPCQPERSIAIPNFKPKGTFPFSRLPGELRNKIYDIVIEAKHYHMEWINNNKDKEKDNKNGNRNKPKHKHKNENNTNKTKNKNKNKSLTYWTTSNDGTNRKVGPHVGLKAAAAHRRRALDSPGGRTRQHLPNDYYGRIPVAPLLVNKLMHEEASSVFYSKNTFDFHGLRAIAHFLDQLQPTAKASLARLVINYRDYGHPKYTIDKYWKRRHDIRWELLCWRIADECTSLTSLSLDLTLNKSPVAFCTFDDVRLDERSDPSVEWMCLLRPFQGVNIKHCWVRVRCSLLEWPVLELESRKIRQEILGEYWNEQDESQRDGFGFEIKRRGEAKEAKMVPRSVVLTMTAEGELLEG